jgi:hypothetical protein
MGLAASQRYRKKTLLTNSNDRRSKRLPPNCILCFRKVIRKVKSDTLTVDAAASDR